MRPQTLFALLSSLLPLATAQAVADGLIVPFTSTLPACASLCGKLFDVQGACVPPVTGEVSSSCFCADPRLKPFLNDGTSGVSTVCTTTSCTAAADLEKIQNWYQGFCNVAVSNPATPTSGSSTPSGSSTTKPKPTVVTHQTWIEGHWKWVVMLVVMVIVISGGWVGAVFFRRRYIRNKEKEFEMRPPVAWGPHQMQGATNGYNYGDGSENSPGGHNKEAGADGIPAAKKGASKSWLRKERT